MAYKDKNTQGHIDLESTETYIRYTMHQIGSVMLEKILNSDKGKKYGVSLESLENKKIV